MEVCSEFIFTIDRDIDVIYRSLLPELEDAHSRTVPDLKVKNNSLILTIHSDDLVSMRAALNGWLRLVKIAVEMNTAIER